MVTLSKREVFETIDRIMKEKKIPQIELSRYLGLSKNVYTEWKSGRLTSYMDYVPQIAEFLGVSANDLMGTPSQSDDDDVSEYLEELRTRPEMRMLFSLAKGATKEDIERAVAIIEALKKTNE